MAADATRRLRSERVRSEVKDEHKPTIIKQGMVSHHLLPCCAASRPRTHDTPTEAKLIGSRQFVYGGMKMLASNKALTAPSLADFLIGIGPLCSSEYHVI